MISRGTLLAPPQGALATVAATCANHDFHLSSSCTIETSSRHGHEVERNLVRCRHLQARTQVRSRFSHCLGGLPETQKWPYIWACNGTSPTTPRGQKQGLSDFVCTTTLWGGKHAILCVWPAATQRDDRSIRTLPRNYKPGEQGLLLHRYARGHDISQQQQCLGS